MTKNRRTHNYKFDRSFYVIAIIIFSMVAIGSFVNSIIHGFTDERVAIILMNAWFILFTMNMISVKFKRQGEKNFWSNWVIFKNTPHVESNKNPQIEEIQESQKHKKAS